MFNQLTQEQLISALANAPAVELQAIHLLREHPPAAGNLFPTGLPRKTYIEATMELIQYSRTCADLAKRLTGLRSIALAEGDDTLIGGYSL